MDTNVLLLIVTILFVAIVVIAIIRFRKRVTAKITGPAGTTVSVHGSNEEAPNVPGVKGEKLISRKGAIRARDNTGRGVDVRDADAHGDIDLQSGSMAGETGGKDHDPKA